MSMSTGDTRRPNTPKSGKATATGSPEPDATEGPRGGVLPVKKATRPAANGAKGARAKTTPAGAGAAKTATKPATTSEDELDEDLEIDVDTDSVDAEDHQAEKSQPSARVKTPTKAAPKPAARKATSGRTQPSRPARPAAKAGSAFAASGGGKGRKPAAPVRVAERRNWGSIGLFILAGVLAIAIIGWSVWPVIKDSFEPTWREKAGGITGVQNFLESNPEWFTYDPNVGNHQRGVLTYPNYPPVGGVHNPVWQNCMGNVYTSQISNEQAVHSLEHGAVWIAYNPSLPQDQIDALAAKVNNVEYLLMSPYPDLDSPISLQAWGYQLKVDNANDDRIDEFISALKINASQEPGAVCSGGITDATVEPLDLPGS
jgi:hypothetical protein